MKKKRLIDRFSLISDLKSEPLPGQTLVELLGTGRVIVENHKGICQYSDSNIIIKVHYGHISVCGKMLHIIKMSKEQLVICGEIIAIKPERRSEK